MWSAGSLCVRFDQLMEVAHLKVDSPEKNVLHTFKGQHQTNNYVNHVVSVLQADREQPPRGIGRAHISSVDKTLDFVIGMHSLVTT